MQDLKLFKIVAATTWDENFKSFWENGELSIRWRRAGWEQAREELKPIHRFSVELKYAKKRGSKNAHYVLVGIEEPE